MQGPTGNPSGSPARAGDRSNDPSGVREWQRNTWLGPAPQNENPFDEPEDAPELRSSRSENVNEHLGDFWRSETGGRGYTAGQTMQQPAKTETGEKARPVRKRNGVRTALLTVLILLAIAAALRFGVFAIREIRVSGNRDLSAEEVIQSSGISLGDGILSLNEKQVEERINGNYKLQFRYLEKQLPGTVVIGIREREACCWLTYCGIHYIVDKNRMVLSETEQMTEEDPNTGEERIKTAFTSLVEVKGLQIRSGCYVGQTMILSSAAQQLLFSELFLEMKVMGCTGEILEADLSNPSSVLLTTQDGYTVSLGDSSRIHEKLRSLMLVKQELQRMGETGGSINVSNPESPLYSPPQT